MKNLFALFIMVSILSCTAPENVNNNSVEQATAAENFDWLLGGWQRINESAGKETYEYWNKKSSTEYLGSGFTMEDADTVWQEQIILVQSNDRWQYEVTGKGSQQPTIFALTAIEKEAFICENAANEFPKKIHYAIAGDSLVAVISDESREVPFIFQRIDLQ